MNCKILVVDDDNTVRCAVAEYLEASGFQVDMAEDAKTAVARMKAAVYDIVILEVNLPRYSGGYSGRYLLSHIHHRYPLIKTIVVTGDTDIETGMESIRLGASHLMTKPFSLVTLKDKISDIILSRKVRILPKRQRHDHLNC